MCLEKWLNVAHKDVCEICGYQYKVKVVETLGIKEVTAKLVNKLHHFSCITSKWAKNGDRATKGLLLSDFLAFLFMTPLSLISVYLCTIGASEYYNASFSASIGLFVFGIFVLLVYVIWLLTTLGYHIREYRKWRVKNQLIELNEV